MRIPYTVASCLALIVLDGCQTPIEYGPLDGKLPAVYGFQETQTREGRYILLISALGGTTELVHVMWDRRARELCGEVYQKQIYRAERPTTTYGYYGGAPGNMVLEGFLKCGAEPITNADTSPAAQ